MCNEKSCYFCKHLFYFDFNTVHDYFCTLTGVLCQNTGANQECQNYCEDIEE